MATANVKAVITAEDRASSVIAGVGNKISALAGIAISGIGFSRMTDAINQTLNASNDLQNSLIGLGSVASAFGQNADAATDAAKLLASDGLMGINEAATALKNLLASGFSLDQAITLVDRFKDSAAFGRQSALSFGEAVSSATEGIKNGNSILVDNAGVTKNLSVILEEAGFSAQDLMKATTDAGIRQALFNGIIRETGPQLGDAARLSATFSGAQARLATAATNTAAKLGDVMKVGITPFVQAASEFVVANQQVIVSVAAAALAVGAFIAILVGGAGLVAAAMAVVAVLGGPLTAILLLIAALVGTVVFGAVQDLQKQMSKTTQSFATGATSIKNSAQDGMGKAGKEARKLAERLSDIDEQMTRTARDFNEQMAQIVSDHKTKVEDLKKQLDDENNDFTQAQTDKTDEFKRTQDDMVREHQRKVADITAQIKQEQIAGSDADQAKLNSLQLRLAQENEDFDRQVALNQAKYSEDTARAVASHEEKKSDFQKKLDEETTFLNKHNEDIKAIQNVQLLDEIDLLKRSHTEQLAELQKQKDRTIRNAQETTNGMAAAFNGLPNQLNGGMLNGVGAQMGDGMATALKNAFKNSFNNFLNDVESKLAPLGEFLLKPGLGKGLLPAGGFSIPKFAGGVTNFEGGLAYVHEGEVLTNLAPGTSVIPKQQVGEMGGRSTINITANVGVYAGTETEKRRLAKELFESLKDIAGSRNMSVAEFLS